MEVITSKSNEKAKFIRSLNEKKSRQKNNCFYLEGIKVVIEVLKDKAVNIKFIALSEEILQKVNGGREILDKDILNNIKVINFSKEVFESIVDTKTPQGILAVIETPINNKVDINNNIILLDKVQDAGNIGTIIRSCDAFGVKQIICIEGTTDVYSQKVLRSTMGSILREKIVYTNDLDMIQNFKNSGYTIVGTVLDENTLFLENLNFEKKYIFIVGNEANGVSDELKQICDMFIKIPMSQSAESLNVSVATSIVLYEQFKNLKNNF